MVVFVPCLSCILSLLVSVLFQKAYWDSWVCLFMRLSFLRLLFNDTLMTVFRKLNIERKGFLLLLFCFVCFVWDRVALCSPGGPRTCLLTRLMLNSDLPVSAGIEGWFVVGFCLFIYLRQSLTATLERSGLSYLLGSQVWTTIPSFELILIRA